MKAILQFLARIFGVKKSEPIYQPIISIPHPTGVTYREQLPWMKIALAEMGQKEIIGQKNNLRIVEYHKSTSIGSNSDEVPWCSSFVTWCLEQAGYESTNSAWARSYLNYGLQNRYPEYGDLIIYKRGENSGHVHFFEHEQGDLYFGVGGNQDNSVSIKGYSKSNVLGIRKPIKAKKKEV